MNTLAPATPIEVWFQDEMRVGQKNGLVYQWAPKGTRPRQPKDQRYENAYLFGAVCPSRNTGIAVIMPHADTEAMQKHIDEIGRAVMPGAHALIILDKAGWHTTRKLKLPDNLTPVPLPPACQDAWRRLLAETGRIASIATPKPGHGERGEFCVKLASMGINPAMTHGRYRAKVEPNDH